MARLPTQQDAETLALRALGFLAAEPERLEPFLATTGLGPATLRAAASEPGFLAAVLDHIGGSDSLLLEFAGNLGVSPEAVALARDRLGGPPSGEAP
ncbi:hypothetical protein IP69_02835 [Bosea sp. AAP35]|uniref:DUF3572 domain-containing protein n=1 Tax=Bosea sp. AAP35 TaxID=1523417 RepID=UPI0006B8C2CD|nr:DUF3572 domain-containing protein [Bosea sp. AAP35]KPF72807.1 hypothetical protein IP69_02835 [Bosea sp. AAP35]